MGAGTLDRNDAWYRDLAGEANWSSVFMTFLDDRDAPTWLMGRHPDGDPVGIVAVSAFDEPGTATITMIGVVPEHRGHGYIDDLIPAGTAAARGAGFTSMLSDADVLTIPMATAFQRNGHRGSIRPWHSWHYRF
jgi:GNAT superfamily N-acetyltransferase